MSQLQKFLLTVDVEALPARAERDHIQRLIWGSFPGREPAGLREMMNEAEAHKFVLTCFFDYCEFDVHGPALLDVAREIVDRGHDLQLHAHPEVMLARTWQRLGIPKPTVALNELSEAQADRLFDWLLDLHGRVSTTPPVAFRGGGYRYNAAILAVMKRKGLLVSSNHNPGRRNQFVQRTSSEIFRHGNGTLEVPISVLHRGEIRSEFNFNLYRFARDAAWFVAEFQSRYGERSVLNLVTHSRSLLELDDEKRYFRPDAGELFGTYRSLLSRLKAGGVQTARISALPEQYATSIGVDTNDEETELSAPTTHRLEEIKSAHVKEHGPMGAKKAQASETVERKPISAGVVKVACPICGAAKGQYTTINGRLNARCGTCGALERQRSLVQAWKASFRHDVPIDGRKALLVSPAKSERMIFDALGFSSVQTLDIRPEARCDIVADLCLMPMVADETFDLVFASHVLPHVHDLDAALSEVARILTPDGAFLSFTPARSGLPTTLADGPTQASRWYGADALRKHQVGSFRSFGDLGLLRDLQRHFVTKTVTGEDPISGRRFMWVCAWKKSAADIVRAMPIARPG